MKDTQLLKQKKDMAVLAAAYRAWTAASALRQKRLRNKKFTYGDQWSDLTTGPDGERITEYELYTLNGAPPITNNMLRQLVKTIVGRFRSQYIDAGKVKNKNLDGVRESNFLDELDSCALEEFLISGCAVQRVDMEYGLCSRRVTVKNVNFNRFFVNALNDPCARDCEIVGQIHDMSVAELMRRVSGGDRKKAEWVRALYCEDAEARTASFVSTIGADDQSGVDFWHAAGGKCRVIEVWTLESREVAVCHNRRKAEVTVLPFDKCGKASADRDVTTRWDIATTWHCRWFSPMGDVLAEWDSPWVHGSHPFVVKMYPLTDGEVHSFVEDVIDQQKFVNRLITIVNHIMNASAKGVLLFPETALPDGMTWRDLRRVWQNCNGVLPYSPGLSNVKPEQVSINATNVGAYEMINLQMKLLEEISGVSGVLQGKTGVASGNSATLYQSEVQNASIALADVFDTFNGFRRERDKKVLGL